MKAFRLFWLPALLLAVSAAGCYGSTQPVVKIGLIAPFEELYREDGYEALNAVRLAVNQRNARGGVGGRQVALVALNDNGRPDESRQQAAKLAVDGDVLGVVGPLRSDSALPAGQILDGQHLAWIALAEAAPDELAASLGRLSMAPTADAMPAEFVQAYQSLAGAQPGSRSLLAYDAANLLLDAMERAAAQGDLDRPSVLQAFQDLGTEGWQGASGELRWRRVCVIAADCG